MRKETMNRNKEASKTGWGFAKGTNREPLLNAQALAAELRGRLRGILTKVQKLPPAEQQTALEALTSALRTGLQKALGSLLTNTVLAKVVEAVPELDLATNANKLEPIPGSPWQRNRNFPVTQKTIEQLTGKAHGNDREKAIRSNCARWHRGVHKGDVNCAHCHGFGFEAAERGQLENQNKARNLGPKGEVLT